MISEISDGLGSYTCLVNMYMMGLRDGIKASAWRGLLIVILPYSLLQAAPAAGGLCPALDGRPEAHDRV